MKRLDDALLTPIYLKRHDKEPAPPDSAFHLLSSDGLFLCRNERFFESAVLARRPPAELASQKQFLSWRCPPISRESAEQAVGFFDWAFRQRGAESVLLIAWNETTGTVEFICPEQTAESYRNTRGVIYPETVRYELPFPLPERRVMIGDIHSHGDGAPYSSLLDQTDELHFNGLHIVVGRLADEPPQWHFEATIDGVRFDFPRASAIESYGERRLDYPSEWRERHRVVYSGHLGPPVPDPPSRRIDGGLSHFSGQCSGSTTWGGAPSSSSEGEHTRRLDRRGDAPPGPEA